MSNFVNAWKRIAGNPDSTVYQKLCALLESYGYHVAYYGNMTILRNTKSEIVAIHYLLD